MGERKWVSIVVLQVVSSAVKHVVGWRLGLTFSEASEANLIEDDESQGGVYVAPQADPTSAVDRRDPWFICDSNPGWVTPGKFSPGRPKAKP
ncbi:hypothetical protein E3N88_17734 [Mikania micrantha]|uniref:Uncharacterized protein n=1 Tax=Mikania micrantha TaxID=192012 RepID=A0A5N6NVE6_9ASTR|nr:hypothetical protein E3N88_17734 [Mikania micrantha]